MPKNNQIVQEMLGEHTTLNCDAVSREIINECIKQIPTAHIKTIALENFNHFKRPFSFFTSSRNYITKIIAAIVQNPHIESLELGPEFCQTYRCTSNGLDDIANLRMDFFLHMKGLKKLILNNQYLDPNFFNSLQIYLTDKRCTLETLELKNGLIAADIELLKTVFNNAFSLKYYNGAGEAELQVILNKNKLNPNNIHNIDEDSQNSQMSLLS